MDSKTVTPQPLKNDRTPCDRDRLQCADHALAQVESELHALENGDNDLTYLIEVLRYGVRRAIEANDGQPATHYPPETRNITH